MQKNMILPKGFGYRFAGISLYAIFVLLVLRLIVPEDLEIGYPSALIILFYVLFFNVASEGNIIFDRLLNNHLPWFFKPKQRLIVQISVTLIWSFLVIAIPFVLIWIINGYRLIYPPFSIITFISATVLLIAFTSIYAALNFFNSWKSSIVEMEELKIEKLRSDYQALQNQLNPHFLFNSFNVLISEIQYNPDTAVRFTRKLSDVYRYVLESRKHDLVALSRELQFIKSYVYLHQVRVGKGLKLVTEIPDNILDRQLPPLSLQILVENALKHNIVIEENPLTIEIMVKDDQTLLIRNNLQLKQALDSTGVGLTNLKNRYRLLTGRDIVVKQDDGFWGVEIGMV